MSEIREQRQGGGRRELVQKLKTGKTCSRRDRIVAEMLHKLPEESFSVLVKIFKLRLMHHPDADDDGRVFGSC